MADLLIAGAVGAAGVYILSSVMRGKPAPYHEREHRRQQQMRGYWRSIEPIATHPDRDVRPRRTELIEIYKDHPRRAGDGHWRVPDASHPGVVKMTHKQEPAPTHSVRQERAVAADAIRKQAAHDKSRNYQNSQPNAKLDHGSGRPLLGGL